MKTMDNSLAAKCDQLIAKYDLLNHPFYQAWSNGTLPVDALRSYAGEYGAFIDTIGRGWQTLGEDDIAKHEAAHALLWRDTFAGPLGTAVGSPNIDAVKELVESAQDLFDRPAAALGALYAFESQQPRTAESKLKGLEDHYTDLPASCGQYFRLHSSDYDEVSCLREAMNGLDEREREETLTACTKMSRALYDALTGIYEPYQSSCTDH